MKTLKATRLEVIDECGRLIVLYNQEIALSYQDDDQTLKIFVTDRNSNISYKEKCIETTN